MERMILLGFGVGLGALLLGIIIGWILNAFSGVTIIIPGTAGMILAAAAGLVASVFLYSQASIDPSEIWILGLALLGIVSGALVAVALGNIFRLSYQERMSAGLEIHRWKWGRLIVAGLLAFGGLKMLSGPIEQRPQATPTERCATMTADLLAWFVVAGGVLWLIRSGTKRPSPSAEAHSV